MYTQQFFGPNIAHVLKDSRTPCKLLLILVLSNNWEKWWVKRVQLSYCILTRRPCGNDLFTQILYHGWVYQQPANSGSAAKACALPHPPVEHKVILVLLFQVTKFTTVSLLMFKIYAKVVVTWLQIVCFFDCWLTFQFSFCLVSPDETITLCSKNSGFFLALSPRLVVDCFCSS